MPANRIKIQNHLEKRKRRKNGGRKINTKPKRKYYLIVCEGERTEPNYFESLKSSLPKGVLDLYNIDVEGTGRNTLSIIKEAIKLRDKYEADYYPRKIDETWAVFDKDGFPAQNFNNAILKASGQTPEIKCAWTNEAFELWYLLHFHFYNTGMQRTA